MDPTQLSTRLQKVLQENEILEFTPVQNQAIPVLLEGKDLIARSKTGSGKTLAYTIPFLEKIRVDQKHLQVLVLCPTRELAAQVVREIRRFGRHIPGLQVEALVGGTPMGPQMAALRRGTKVAVATPGRLIDLIERASIDLSRLNVVVLDEADRMLDMGFQDDIRAILEHTPMDRQTVLFSATFPESVQGLAQEILRNPEQVEVEDTTEAEILELHTLVEEDDKLGALMQVLSFFQPHSGIIFCHLKSTVAALAEELQASFVAAGALHGDLLQEDRDKVMAQFRNGSVRFLVATDVAARGIDVAGLDIVVNFDFPRSDVYVHRVGRTGRAGKKGLAITFATDPGKVTYLEKNLERAIPEWEEKIDPEQEIEGDFSSEWVTLYIGGGRKDKIRPGDILGSLTGEANIPASDIGKIEIHDRFSYVAVARKIAKSALDRLRIGRIKAKKFRIERVE